MVSIDDTVAAITKRLADEGKVVEAGWIAMRWFILKQHEAKGTQITDAMVEELRDAYFAGAQHVWSAVMTIMDEGAAEPTERDLSRMDKINDEMTAWYQGMQGRG